MNEEKILAFLNLDRDKKIDKSIMKISCCFDFGFTLFIIICGLTFGIYSFKIIHILFFVLFLLCDLGFYIWYKSSENPTSEISFVFSTLLATDLKLLFAFITFSKENQKEITLSHFLVLFICIFLAFWIIRGKYLVWQDLKNNTIEQAKINAKNRKSNKPIIPLSTTATITVLIFLLIRRTSFSIGIELIFWCLACLWLIMVIICAYNFYFIKKYNVADMFIKREYSE